MSELPKDTESRPRPRRRSERVAMMPRPGCGAAVPTGDGTEFDPSHRPSTSPADLPRRGGSKTRCPPTGSGWVWLVAVVLTGCSSVDDPAPAPTRKAVDRAIRRVLIGNPTESISAIEAARVAIAEYESSSGRSTRLGPALGLLAAAREIDREARIERLQELSDGEGDEVALRLAEGALERDPVWLAEALDSDSVYSDFASFLNGVTQTFAAAIQGNPIATLQPLVVGIEGVLHGLPLDARDRARLALERRLRLEGLDTEHREGLSRRIARLHDQTAREELWLARRAVERGAFSTARAHLSVARMLDVGFEEIDAVAERIESASRRADSNRESAMEILAPPAEWSSDAAARRVAVSNLEAIFGAAPPPPYTPRPSPAQSIEIAKSEHSRATWRFIFTGHRDERDALRRHLAARRAETRSWLDVVAPIVWLPATIVRGVYVAVGYPIDDRGVLDAEAAFARLAPGGQEREEVLRDLAARYLRRDEIWKALLSLREAGANREELEPIEERLAERMSRTEGVDPELRRVRLAWLVEALPDTRFAEQAQAELEATEGPRNGKAVPLSIAIETCAKISPLGLDPRWTNGDARDGEIDPPRLQIEGSIARVEVRQAGSSREIVLELDTVQAAKLHALADEWAWRYRAARAQTYPTMHSGVPVELYAGFGANGLAVYPRLLPEGYERADRRLFE